MTDAALLRVENTAGILRLTLMRGAQRNPLSSAMLEQLVAALEAAATDKTVRAIVMAGEAPGFCGGHDLKEMTAHRPGR